MTESRNPQSIDPERLAALVDGRLGAVDAAAVRAELAGADDETLAAFADAVAITGEAAGESEPVSVSRIRDHVRSWPYVYAAIGAAAVVSAVMVMRNAKPNDPYSFARAVSVSTALPTESVWSANRGTGIDGNGAARSTRIGALLVDLEIATRQHDSAATTIANSIAAQFDEISASGGVGGRLRSAAMDSIARSGDAVLSIAREGSRFADEPFVRAGAWLEAARIAGSVSDTSFISRYPARSALSELLRRTDLDSGRRAAVRSFLIRAANGPASETTEASIKLLRELGT